MLGRLFSIGCLAHWGPSDEAKCECTENEVCGCNSVGLVIGFLWGSGSVFYWSFEIAAAVMHLVERRLIKTIGLQKLQNSCRKVFSEEIRRKCVL